MSCKRFKQINKQNQGQRWKSRDTPRNRSHTPHYKARKLFGVTSQIQENPEFVVPKKSQSNSHEHLHLFCNTAICLKTLHFLILKQHNLLIWQIPDHVWIAIKFCSHQGEDQHLVYTWSYPSCNKSHLTTTPCHKGTVQVLAKQISVKAYRDLPQKCWFYYEWRKWRRVKSLEKTKRTRVKRMTCTDNK